MGALPNTKLIEQQSPFVAPRLFELVLYGVARASLRSESKYASSSSEEQVLNDIVKSVSERGYSFATLLRNALLMPAKADQILVSLRKRLGLSIVELLVISLTAAVEEDVLVGRILSHVQSPVGGSRPTLGLIERALGGVLGENVPVLPMILQGRSVRMGLLKIENNKLPLPERTLSVSEQIYLALLGYDGYWHGTTIDLPEHRAIAIGNSTLEEAKGHVKALQVDPQRVLLIRSGSSSEGRTVAAKIAVELSQKPVYVETEHLDGIGPWLVLRGLLPVFCLNLSPGERVKIRDMPGYEGPLIVLAGPDGAVESDSRAVIDWKLSVPGKEERSKLWRKAIGENNIVDQLSSHYLHSAGRIAHLGQVSHHYASIDNRELPAEKDVLLASWNSEGGQLESLAIPVKTQVPDDALVTTPELKNTLEKVLLRCQLREGLVNDLGTSLKVRYRPGVRALFTGSSGTGKTLAASWIATQLGVPMYRVDLASLTSKYIGETEKNLSQLLAKAEHAEVILLFDEADSLFGKRTDVNDSNDRFANAQTNYLLQRIEEYDGIVLLTSNSQTRFDPAFMRRLDFTITFPDPGPGERKSIWKAHLGDSTSISNAQLNQIATLIDINGGLIRNAVLTAAVYAAEQSGCISFCDLLHGVAGELRKLGKQMPMELVAQM